MTTPAASHRNADPLRPSRFGIRSRILLALLLASAPGIVFGALEAQRTFRSAVARDAADLSQGLDRVGAALDQTIDDATRAAQILAAFAPVRAAAPGCETAFAATAPNERFAAAGRLEAGGDLVCSQRGRARISLPSDGGMARLRTGATTTITTLAVGRLSGEPVVVAATPLRSGGRFDGAVFVSIRRTWVEAALASAGAPDIAAFAFDPSGALMATAIGSDIDSAQARETARAALQSGAGTARRGALIAAARTTRTGARIVVVRPERTVLISARAALVALAPVTGVGLGMLGIWAALDIWVLRWIHALAQRVRRGGDATMAADRRFGAPPPEVFELAEAFDAAAAANLRLTRELHHRVKNNLQVLLSLVARQQKRADDAATRDALGQARARMLAIAIVHRFIDPPDDRGVIDLDAYLAELCRQLVSALNPSGRRLRIDTALAPDSLPIDSATVVGLLVAETAISLQSARGPATVRVTWTTAPRRLEMRFDDGRFHSEDEVLVRELARQAGGRVTFMADGVVIEWAPAAAEIDAARADGGVTGT